MKKLKEKIRGNQNAKLIVMIFALLETVLNLYCFYNYVDHGTGGIALLLILSSGMTGFLYYVADGFKGFLSFLSVVSKVIGTLVGYLGILTAWMMGLGFLIQSILLPVMKIVVFGCGVLIAYLMPIIFIPVFGFVFKKSENSGEYQETEILTALPRMEKAQSEEVQSEEVNWNRVYENVLKNVK